MENSVKRVLIVDDEETFLESLYLGLSAFPVLDVVVAENGARAVELLDSEQTVDLVVTDLHMPVMDGFALMAHMSRHQPDIPLIAMSADSSPSALDRAKGLGLIRYLEKPIDFDDLADSIFEALASVTKGFLQGISVISIMQLLEMEAKTATLTVSDGRRLGTLCFLRGRLIHAATEDLQGDEAAMKIISWEGSSVEIENICRSKLETVQTGLQFLIMESLRLKDEASSQLLPSETSDVEEAEQDSILDMEVLDLELYHDMSVFAEDSDLQLHEGADDRPSNHMFLTEEKTMNLENHLKGLREIKGYKASAIMNYTGEVLITDSVDTSIDLGLVGATFNDIFRSAHDASEKIGLEACTETTIKTPKGIVIMRCSGVRSQVHFHVIVVMDEDGNQALAKMKIESTIPKMMAEL